MLGVQEVVGSNPAGPMLIIWLSVHRADMVDLVAPGGQVTGSNPGLSIRHKPSREGFSSGLKWCYPSPNCWRRRAHPFSINKPYPIIGQIW
jgi:hypothetical protein